MFPFSWRFWLRCWYEQHRHNYVFYRRLEKQTLMPWLALRSEDRVCELGCFNGANARALSQRYGCHVEGIDIDSDFIHTAQECNNTEQTHFSVAAAESLPFANESFDKILGISVLEHFQDGRQALQEAFRCLEPGGVLALTTDSFSLGEIWQGTQKRHAERFSVCHYYSKSELQDAVAQAGYLPLRVEPILRHRFTGFFFEWSIWTNGVKSLAFVLLPLMQVVEYFWGSQEAGYMMMICAQKPKHC